MADDADIDTSVLEAERLKQLEDREKRADAALRSGKPADALRIALENPPFASKDSSMKERSTALASRSIVALGSKDADLTAFLATLSPDEADILMKYVYACLKTASNSGVVLKVHALLVEKAGIGCIVRAIVDRKGPN